MRLPEEIVAESFAPAFRTLLARALADRGLPQQAIADALGVSQAAVSKHLAGRVAVDPLLAGDPRVAGAVARIADGLAARTLPPFEVLAASMALVRALETRGPVCAIHEREMPALAGLGCDLCVRLGQSPVQAEQAVLANVREAVRLLESHPAFARLLPKVGSNVAMALAGARDRAEVAAIPGGLFEMRGAAKAPAPPEFGVSRHVAAVLLGAHRAEPRVRGCVNVGGGAALAEAAQRAGLRPVEIAPADDGDADAIARRAPGADVLWHGGAFGVEPVAYVLGTDAVDAARKALRLTP